MNFRIVKMNLDDFLIRHVGKIMIGIGIAGIIFILLYDKIIGRCSSEYSIGAVQIITLLLPVSMIYVGWVFNRLMKIFKEDMK